jgi:hypothetical protein
MVMAVWLVTTERLRREPRIRALLDFLAVYMMARACRAPYPDGGEAPG